jgi:hypothetical protein
MEIIHLEEWGKRVSTGLRLEQANWMQDYINNGGSAWVVVRVGLVTCLFWGDCAESLLDRPNPKRFVEMATWSKNGNLSKEDWKHVENMTSEECTKCTMVPTLDQHFITVPEFLAWSNEKVIAMLCVKEPKNVRESIDALVQANATHRAFLEIHVNDLIEYVQDAMPVIPPSVRFLAEVGSLEEYEKLVNVTLGALHPALRARIWAAELDKGYEKWIPGGNVTVAIARDLHPLGIKTLTPTSSEVLPSEASQRKIYDKGFDAVYTYGTTAGVKARTAADKARGVSPP